MGGNESKETPPSNQANLVQTDALKRLCENLVRINFSNPTNEKRVGTGLIIHQQENLLFILTCLHNICNQTEQSSLVLRTTDTNQEVKVTCRKQIYPLKEWVYFEEGSDNDGADIALFITDAAVKDNYQTIKLSSDASQGRTWVMGYPDGGQLQCLDGSIINSDQKVLDRTFSEISHNCKTSGGSSGSPILQRNQKQFVVVGVHTRSNSDQSKNGVRLNNGMLNFINKTIASKREEKTTVIDDNLEDDQEKKAFGKVRKASNQTKDKIFEQVLKVRRLPNLKQLNVEGLGLGSASLHYIAKNYRKSLQQLNFRHNGNQSLKPLEMKQDLTKGIVGILKTMTELQSIWVNNLSCVFIDQLYYVNKKVVQKPINENLRWLDLGQEFYEKELQASITDYYLREKYVLKLTQLFPNLEKLSIGYRRYEKEKGIPTPRLHTKLCYRHFGTGGAKSTMLQLKQKFQLLNLDDLGQKTYLNCPLEDVQETGQKKAKKIAQPPQQPSAEKVLFNEVQQIQNQIQRKKQFIKQNENNPAFDALVENDRDELEDLTRELIKKLFQENELLEDCRLISVVELEALRQQPIRDLNKEATRKHNSGTWGTCINLNRQKIQQRCAELKGEYSEEEANYYKRRVLCKSGVHCIC